jgi:hypothetical protein
VGYREVKIYVGPFPTFEQIVSGDPTVPSQPNEVWLQQMRPGEFAVRYRDFKTGLARNPEGERISRSSEICRIFESLSEARENSRQVVQAHWTVRCFAYDHTGKQLESIANTREVNKFALAMYASILLWGALFACAGMLGIWCVYRLGVLLFAPTLHLIHLTWLGWAAFAISGLVLGILGWLLSVRFKAETHVNEGMKKLQSAIAPEERKRFEELNTLYGSADPAERQRFLELMREYQHKLKQAMRK